MQEVQFRQRHHQLLRPKILKTDFRRNYANMWVNVFNSGDYGLMTKHIDTYYARDLLVQQRDMREGKNVQFIYSVL